MCTGRTGFGRRIICRADIEDIVWHRRMRPSGLGFPFSVSCSFMGAAGSGKGRFRGSAEVLGSSALPRVVPGAGTLCAKGVD